MTPPTIAEPRPELVSRGFREGRPAWIEAVTSTDHKAVAKLYIGSAAAFLAAAVVEFALTRVQLIAPDNTLINPETFARINSAATVSAVVLFAVPLLLGLIGYIVPLQIGARGVAHPRLNQLSFWLFGFGAFAIYAGFLYSVTEGGLAALPPLSDGVFSPAHGIDSWIIGTGLAVAGFVCFAINMVATLANMRAPGLAWRRASLFTWCSAVISWTILVIGPIMLAALTMLFIDRHYDGVFFDSGEGGAPQLYEHLSWIFFTGVQAIVIIGAAGIVSEILPTFARKPIFSHRAVATSMAAIAVLSFFAWMQNMYAAPLPKGFAFMAMAAAIGLLVPIGTLIYVWIATLWQGALKLRAPSLFAIAGVVLMTLGLAGQLATAVIPVGWQLEHTTAAQQDTITVLIGGSVLIGFAALHYWVPKITGRYVGEGIAKVALLTIVGGIVLYGFAMFFAGLKGQPVDVYRFYEGTGLSGYNLIASLGAFAIAAGVLAELGNLAHSYGNGRPAPPDPWGGSTLEWFTLSPPVPHNFDAVPDVRSNEPFRDIREAIRDRAAAFVPPAAEPVPPSPQPEPTPEPEPEPAPAAEIEDEMPEEPDAGPEGDAPVA